MNQRIVSATLALCLCMSALPAAHAEQEEAPQESFLEEGLHAGPSAYAEVHIPTESEVYETLIAFKSRTGYTEGTLWDNSNHSYNWNGGPVAGNITGGTGCAAFAFELSDAAFGSLTARTFTTGNFQLSDVRAGDILRILGNSHSVIVLQASTSGVVIAEANYHVNGGPGMVHWERTLTKEEVEAADYFITRYPEGYDPGTDPDGPIDEAAQGSFNGLNWKAANNGTLTISGSGEMQVDANNLPWKDYTSRILNIVIEDGVTSVAGSAFKGSGALGVTIPSSVKSIGDNAFRECLKLVSVTFAGSGVESIGENAFRSCGALTSITLPASVRSVGAGAFFQCQKMTEAVFQSGTETVAMGDDLFSGCYELRKVTLPKQIDRISERMFQNCLCLTGLTVSEGANSIGGSAFASCSRLTQVWIPNSVEQIGTAAFASCGSLTDIYFSGSEAEWGGVSKLGDTSATLSSKTMHYNADAPEIPETPETPPAPGDHVHSWATAWSSDSSYHWHECSAENCGGKDGYGTHSYGGWVVDASATASQSGSRHRTCTVCGYTQTESIPATGGSSSNGGDSDSSSGSGSSSSSSSAANTAATTTRNPDGSTTTTKTDKTTGTVTETTRNPDGSQTVVETKKDGTVTTQETDQAGNKTETVAKPDGSSTVTVERKDGTAAVVTIQSTGRMEAEVKLSASAVSAARQNGETITLPIPELQPARDRQIAPAVTVNTGSAGPVKVNIPTAAPTPGTVAVMVHADGTEEVIKTSVPTADGVAASLPDGATVKLVDNSKDFADVSSQYWAADAIAFVSARELFAGTTAEAFTPDAPMTRAMLMTVLARLDGVNTSEGATWSEKGMEWAIAKGISDGSTPNGSISREQLITMLWRYAGSPAAAGTLSSYTDEGQINGYAQEAMRWAVENGVINGFGDGRLKPQGQATRAQVAQMLKSFVEKQSLAQ